MLDTFWHWKDAAVLACSLFLSIGYSNPTPVGPFDVVEKRLCSQDAWRQRLELFVQDLALAEAIRWMVEGWKRWWMRWSNVFCLMFIYSNFAANYLLGKISMHRFHVQDRIQYGVSIQRRFAMDTCEFMSTTSVFTSTFLPLHLILICKNSCPPHSGHDIPIIKSDCDWPYRMKASSKMQNHMPGAAHWSFPPGSKCQSLWSAEAYEPGGCVHNGVDEWLGRFLQVKHRYVWTKTTFCWC